MTLGFCTRPQNTIGAPGFHYTWRPGDARHGRKRQRHAKALTCAWVRAWTRCGQRTPHRVHARARKEPNAIVTALSMSSPSATSLTSRCSRLAGNKRFELIVKRISFFPAFFRDTMLQTQDRRRQRRQCGVRNQKSDGNLNGSRVTGRETPHSSRPPDGSVP